MAYPKIKVKVGKGRDPIEIQQVFDPDLKTYNKLVAAAINEVYSKIQNGGLVKVDNTLSSTSANPVQNKVITKALGSKLSVEDLAQAISEALMQAKNSGEFDGADGRTPVKGVDYYTHEEVQALVAELFEMVKSDVQVAKIGYVTLLATEWLGEDNLYSQVVDIEGVTANSQVDLTPDVQQLAVFYNKDLSFVTENDGGVVTVYAIGQKPANDYTIQVTITEVDV